VRTHLIAIGASAILAALLAAGCGGSSAGPSAGSLTPSARGESCVQAGAPHHAYLVVEHKSGTTVRRCVGFTGDTIDGETLMKRSGVEYQTADTSSGRSVCQIDQEPAHFSTCFPPGQPYWSLWVTSGGGWSYAQTGYTQIKLHDHEALGWEYVPQTGPSPSPPPLPGKS
jgi:hypothetical protein